MTTIDKVILDYKKVMNDENFNSVLEYDISLKLKGDIVSAFPPIQRKNQVVEFDKARIYIILPPFQKVVLELISTKRDVRLKICNKETFMGILLKDFEELLRGEV